MRVGPRPKNFLWKSKKHEKNVFLEAEEMVFI